MKTQLFQQGCFFIGCNYWASHAGMKMWSRWDEQIVKEDLRRLSENHIRTLRVFPLWSDFQPLRMHYCAKGQQREIRLLEEPLGFDDFGRAGIDPTMMERFQRFCDLAQTEGISLIVGLLTGWMSGRLFIPEMLQGRNVLTDPLAIQWEIRFVRCFVRHFAYHPAIVAWDLGNECNCMGEISAPEVSYVWSASITMAIRVEDPKRPIISGMHGLSTEGEWRIQDQGEVLDILCTHPYPIFTPHCDTDPLNGMKSPLHATAESLFFAGVGGKPCFAEEVGTLGPMVVSDEIGADYLRMALFTLLGNDCHGLIWWCGFEQSNLDFSPYDWNSVERELGLFYLDKTPKPVLRELRRFSEYIDMLPVSHLPARINEAVCILTRGQDSWTAAYGAFMLAVQAGIGIRFTWTDNEIPDAPVYMLPDLEGDAALSRHVLLLLLEKVHAGATLYLSLNGALLSPFSEFSGLRVLTRAHHPQRTTICFNETEIEVSRNYRLQTESIGAEVLARTCDGEIAFVRNKYGAGTVYTLLFPIEKSMATEPGVVDRPDIFGAFRFYQAMNLSSAERILRVENPMLGVTEHICSKEKHIAIIVNYTSSRQQIPLLAETGWRVNEVYPYRPGDGFICDTIELSPNSAITIVLERA